MESFTVQSGGVKGGGARRTGLAGRIASRFKTFGTLAGLSLFCATSLSGGDEFFRTSHQVARLFSYGTLVIDSRVGDIRVEGWDEPRVEVEAEKLVRANSQAKAETLFDRIGIDLLGGDHEVRLVTIFPRRRLWRPFRGESQLAVNLRVKMPYDANLRLKCVDGDVQVRGVVGTESLRVSYGDVEIDVPSVYRLRSLAAHAWLGYVESELHGEGSAGLSQRLWFWNSKGVQDINVNVRMGGVWVYSDVQ